MNMAGLADVFSKEDRVSVKFSDFYNIMKEVVKAEMLMNAVNCNVPHIYIREMATGVKEDEDRWYGMVVDDSKPKDKEDDSKDDKDDSDDDYDPLVDDI